MNLDGGVVGAWWCFSLYAFIVDCSGWVNIVLEMLLMGNLTCPLFGLCMWK